jgi:hypothetical protein
MVRTRPPKPPKRRNDPARMRGGREEEDSERRARRLAQNAARQAQRRIDASERQRETANTIIEEINISSNSNAGDQDSRLKIYIIDRNPLSARDLPQPVGLDRKQALAAEFADRVALGENAFFVCACCGESGLSNEATHVEQEVSLMSEKIHEWANEDIHNKPGRLRRHMIVADSEVLVYEAGVGGRAR